MFVNASVLAMRSGMINGTLEEGFPRASKTKANGFFSLRTKVLSFVAAQESVDSANFCPSPSRLDQRSMEAMTSADRTGVPSWNMSPLRRVNV